MVAVEKYLVKGLRMFTSNPYPAISFVCIKHGKKGKLQTRLDRFNRLSVPSHLFRPRVLAESVFVCGTDSFSSCLEHLRKPSSTI